MFLHRFEDILWKVMPDSKSGILVCELRNKQERQVYYAVGSLLKGKMDILPSEEIPAWWVGLLEIFGQVALLHGYEKEGLPNHKGVYAIDLLTGKLLWSREDAVMAQTFVEGIQLEDGQVLNWENGQQTDKEVSIPLQEVRDEIRHFPSLHLESSAIFDNWKQKLEQVQGITPVYQMACWENEHQAYLQLYQGEIGKDLKSSWMSWDKANKQWEILGEAACEKLMLDSFFVEGDFLFYSPDSHTVVWQQL
ncbi:MAG: DUF4905 domain-containing protein [Bacteroidota bacterium]